MKGGMYYLTVLQEPTKVSVIIIFVPRTKKRNKKNGGSKNERGCEKMKERESLKSDGVSSE